MFLLTQEIFAAGEQLSRVSKISKNKKKKKERKEERKSFFGIVGNLEEEFVYSRCLLPKL